MTNYNELNKMAAEICGYKVKINQDSIVEGFIEIEPTKEGLRRFSLGKPKHREIVVIALGEKHSYSITNMSTTSNGITSLDWYHVFDHDRFSIPYDTYVEAVIAAVEEVGASNGN